MAKRKSAAALRGEARRARLKAEQDAAKLAQGDTAKGAQAGAGAAGKAAKAAGGKSDGPFKVRAIQPGYYDLIRRRDGDVFTVANQRAFSPRWMQRVSAATPDRITTGAEELQQKHDETLAEKVQAKAHATGAGNPLGAE